MKRVLVVAMLGLAGLVAATSLTLGALAVAGDEVGSVLRPRLDDRGGPSLAPSASVTRSPDPDRGTDDRSTGSWTPSSRPSGTGATNGPSDDASSGSGSDDTEPHDGGSDSSGSGSDDSGSGGSDEHDDD